MNKTQKIIWTIYFLLFFSFLIVKIYFSETRIIQPYEIIAVSKGYPLGLTPYTILWRIYLFTAWIPALILSGLWKDKKIKKKNNSPNVKSRLLAFFSKWYKPTPKQ